MVITEPSPQGFRLNQTQLLGSGSIFHPKIYSFDANVSLAGSEPFATVIVPQVKGKDGTEIIVEQWVDLSDADEFGDFSTAVMMNEEFQMNIYGRPHLKLGELPTIHVDYNKTVTMKGKWM